jgi:hypothetical protein
MSDPEALVRQVSAAFPVEPRPPQEALFNNHCDECIEVSNAFGGRPWPEISLSDLLAGGETALLTPAAWRYYVPVMITWCVREPEAVGVIGDNLVYQLEPPEPGMQDEWFEERRDGFSEGQRQTFVAYLDWYRERQEAEYVALEMEPPRHVYRALTHWTAAVAGA